MWGTRVSVPCLRHSDGLEVQYPPLKRRANLYLAYGEGALIQAGYPPANPKGRVVLPTR